MKRVLLTGASGFIGSHCIAPLRRRGYEVVAVVSAMGKDFFRRFEAGWQEEVLPREVAISVVERPSARWGNLVQVEYGQYLLYRGVHSQTRRWTIESLAEQAVPAAAQRLTELILLSRYETDLGKDEF